MDSRYPRRGMEMMKATIDIEDLLVWAYRTELPKAQVDTGRLPLPRLQKPSMWSGSTAVADLGQRVDNMWGVVPDQSATGEPHPDAIMVAEAVASLDVTWLDVPEGWWPFGDMAGPEEWGELGAGILADAMERISHVGEDGVRRFKASPAKLVRRYAVMGDCPVWESDIVPKMRTVRTATGQNAWFVMRSIPVEAGGFIEVEQDGFNPSRRRPYPGAYQKHELSPSPFPVALDRAEYEVWHAALSLLAVELGESGLSEHLVTGPRRPARPWIDGMPQSIVLPCVLRRDATFA